MLLIIFRRILEDNPAFQAIYLGLETDGTMSPLRPKQDLPAGFDARKQPWYQGAVSGNGLYYSDIYTDEAVGKAVLSISVPIKDQNGNLIGVLGADVSLDSVAQMANTVTIGNKGSIAYEGRNGTSYSDAR